MISNQSTHQSVLLEEAMLGLLQNSEGVYVDGTFGRGGHSHRILQGLSSQGRLLAIDKDPDAINSENAKELMADSRFELTHASFSELHKLLEERGSLGKVAGILLDLGVSSPQLDVAERGFSFMKDGPLDMRMDPTQGESASQWLERVAESDLVNVLRVYGEEKFARKIAAAIVSQREEKKIETTRQLASIIEEVVKKREPGKHPATRSFQAIRIKINKELDDLEEVLEQSIDALEKGGRLVVISFHSLEDRVVKRFMRNESRAAVVARHLPLPLDYKQLTLKCIGKAIKASPEEVKFNARSRSAVLRIAERL